MVDNNTCEEMLPLLLNMMGLPFPCKHCFVHLYIYFLIGNPGEIYRSRGEILM